MTKSILGMLAVVVLSGLSCLACVAYAQAPVVPNACAVRYDTTAPVVTLNGATSTTIVFSSFWKEPGAKAVDNLDGTVPVLVSGTVRRGTNTLTYTATDLCGNVGKAVRTVKALF